MISEDSFDYIPDFTYNIRPFPRLLWYTLFFDKYLYVPSILKTFYAATFVWRTVDVQKNRQRSWNLQ